MSLKLIKLIGSISIFVLCFGCHFIYEWFPNALTAIFFPINESIWEHMKLLATPYLLFSIVEYLLLKKEKIMVHNFLLQLFITPILGILIYLAIYIPLYLWIGENMFISIFLLFLVIILMEVISYFFLIKKEIKWQNIIGFIGIIITYIVFGYLVYKPFQNFLFLDISQGQYGINTYRR